MFRSLRTTPRLCLALLILLLIGCQPIRPETFSSHQECSNADKLALLPAFAGALQKGDVDSAAAQFLPDATFSFDVGPRLDPETGKYVVPSRVETVGREQYLGVFQAIINLRAGIYIENPILQGDTVTAVGGIVGSEAYSFGTPTTNARVEFTITIQDCKIASYDAHYPQSELETFPEKAAILDKLCSDEYKTKVFQQYINGIDNGDAVLAALPYASDARYEFQPIPIWSEAEKSYVNPPANFYDGLDEFKPIIDYFISIGLFKILDLSSVSLTRSTLNVKATLSSQSFTGEPWLLPVTEVNGDYIVTFNENCKIADLKWKMEEGSAEKLTELKNSK